MSIDTEIKENYAGLMTPAGSADKFLKVADFTPFAGHILVKPIPPDSQIGKIILPPKAQEKKAVGYVLRIPTPTRPDEPHNLRRPAPS